MKLHVVNSLMMMSKNVLAQNGRPACQFFLLFEVLQSFCLFGQQDLMLVKKHKLGVV